MKIEIRKIGEGIYLSLFRNQKDLTSTFLRFQEYYESPFFKGKIFSIEEYKKWYIKNSPNGKKTKKFTYYSDWNGFNIPSSMIAPFIEGRFDPLSINEKRLLKKLKNLPLPFYLIGMHKKIKNYQSVLNHELAHALFHTNKIYKKEVINILSKYDLKNIKERLRISLGYHEDVLEEEINSYVIDGDEEMCKGLDEKLINKLELKFKEYIKK